MQNATVLLWESTPFRRKSASCGGPPFWSRVCVFKEIVFAFCIECRYIRDGDFTGSIPNTYVASLSFQGDRPTSYFWVTVCQYPVFPRLFPHSVIRSDQTWLASPFSAFMRRSCQRRQALFVCLHWHDLRRFLIRRFAQISAHDIRRGQAAGIGIACRGKALVNRTAAAAMWTASHSPAAKYGRSSGARRAASSGA